MKLSKLSILTQSVINRLNSAQKGGHQAGMDAPVSPSMHGSENLRPLARGPAALPPRSHFVLPKLQGTVCGDWSAPGRTSDAAAHLYDAAVEQALASLGPAPDASPSGEEPPPRYEAPASPQGPPPRYESWSGSSAVDGPQGDEGVASSSCPSAAGRADGASSERARQATGVELKDERRPNADAGFVSKASVRRWLRRPKGEHAQPRMLPPLGAQQQLEVEAFRMAMDAQRDQWLERTALRTPSPVLQGHWSSRGVTLATEIAGVVEEGVRKDIEDARMHVDKFLQLSHKRLKGESLRAGEERRAGTPAEAGRMFDDRMSQISENRDKKLGFAIRKGMEAEPEAKPVLLELARCWGLDLDQLRNELDGSTQSPRTAAAENKDALP